MVSRHFGGHSSAKPLQIDEGSGAPTHAADRATLYWDYTNQKLYINTDGVTTWIEKTPGAGATTTHWARRAGAEIWLPATGGPVTLTSGARSVFGNWTAIGTPAADFYLSHLMVHSMSIPTNLCMEVVEFGYGAGPTALDVTRIYTSLVDPTADAVGYMELDCRSRPTKVLSGVPVSARAYSGVAAMEFECMVAGWDASYPVWDALPVNTVAGPGRFYPSNTYVNGIVVVAGAWGTWGTAKQVVASAPNDMLVTQLMQTYYNQNLLVGAVAYQIGYGPAGSETWCATLLAGRVSRAPWVWPPVWVKAGERLAVRAQDPGAGTHPFVLKVHDM